MNKVQPQANIHTFTLSHTVVNKVKATRSH